MRMLAVVAALITHANVAHVPAAADLAAQVRASTTLWIGYTVPAVEGQRLVCDQFMSGDRSDELRPAAGSIAVAYRVAGGAIEKVRGYSIDCPLDGGGTSVTWIDGVDPRQSVALLASLAGGERSMARGAVTALALHGDPSAGDRLAAWAASPAASDELRGQALFWLAETRPQRAMDAARLVAGDRSASRRLREKAVFALSQIRTPDATDELIRIARRDDDAHVRGQALFWLAQQAGKKAAGAIREAVDRDDDSAVRAKAVFAISQLPDDQGVPLLVDLMKNHRDPAVRKKAAFWLGQKRDPRALDALEEFLRR